MLLEDFNFKPLKQKLSLNHEKNEKFFIFASSHRLFCRSFYRFREVFRLATGPLGFSKGLFLFHSLSNNYKCQTCFKNRAGILLILRDGFIALSEDIRHALSKNRRKDKERYAESTPSLKMRLNDLSGC